MLIFLYIQVIKYTTPSPFTSIINPPQAAILGAGRIREVRAIYKEKVRRRYLMGLSVTCDHRVIVGAPAARFLGDICRLV
jgi:pyruvate dehydrogenase E2 component (dihydrolipoamide acetyltransferase)